MFVYLAFFAKDEHAASLTYAVQPVRMVRTQALFAPPAGERQL